MRDLFFHAVAGNPKVAQPLAWQAQLTLRTFGRYLSQAIHTAKQRQFRYQLPWETVREKLVVRIEPLDTRFRVMQPEPSWIVTNWPDGKEPDGGQQLMLVNKGVTLSVLDWRREGTTIRFRVDGPLDVSDQVYWCGHHCSLEQTLTPSSPSTVTLVDGQPLKLARAAVSEDSAWILWAEGDLKAEELVVDGSRLPAERLPWQSELRRLRDSKGATFEFIGGNLKADALPAEGDLVGDDGGRYRWHQQRRSGRSGEWVQLLLPESEDDDFLDPRAAFCEDELGEVWTDKQRRKETAFRVRKVDRERYQLLLDRLPPEGSKLYLPVDIRNLLLQRRALRQLMDAPLPHHQGLLRLCEHPAKVRWPACRPRQVHDEDWKVLTNDTRDGTDEQRRFVAKALGTPDFAFLEGPPGSGKTTAICEIVEQLLAEGKRVLLCASTHVAIDNVLERLVNSRSPVDALRIGKQDKVDEKLEACQIDNRVNALVEAWRETGRFVDLDDEVIREAAERTIFMAANLTCGTTMGIVNHPLFRDRDLDMPQAERPVSKMPHWDVLVVDEASKTLIQEFVVPALMARKWIVVGDVRQLPPFADRSDIVANLRCLVDDKEREVFPAEHQRAALLLFRLDRPQLRRTGLQWLICEPPGVLDWLVKEMERRPGQPPTACRVVRRKVRNPGAVSQIEVEEIRNGEAASLGLLAHEWVLVGTDLLSDVAEFLPPALTHTEELTGATPLLPEHASLFFRHRRWLEKVGRLREGYRERGRDVSSCANAESTEQKWLAQHDWAGELAWRLTRLHELRRSRRPEEKEKLDRSMEQLFPRCADVTEQAAEIQDIGLPSVLEVIQEGVGVERAKRPSALTEGMRARGERPFEERFGSLSFQHRMNPGLSDFPREVVYEGKLLKDANTIAARDEGLGWDFGPFPARRIWAHVSGREEAGVNQQEIDVMHRLLSRFCEWALVKGNPNRETPKTWEVACLCFYLKQERAISDMLRKFTGDAERVTRFLKGNVEIVCGTVDRFQGREADLVLLSMRNTKRIGFLDSPNRLNVAVTRPRQQLVVIGNADYFSRCEVSELEELVRRSRRVPADSVGRGGR